MKIGFIGFGNMAQATANGLVGQGAVAADDIYACAKNWDKLCQNTQAKGYHPCRDAQELAESVDMVVVAVKPYMVQEVITPIRHILKEKMVVSVVAGFPFEKYEEILEPGTHHISTVPNTPVSIGEGIIICEDVHSLTQEEYTQFENLFSKIGLVQPIDTKHMSVAGTVSGCGPAFVSMFIEALSDAAVKHGIPRAMSYRLVSQMVAGTGKLQLATGQHPGAMKDAVCSPGGTTIVGVAALERHGLRSAVIEAVDAIEGK